MIDKNDPSMKSVAAWKNLHAIAAVLLGFILLLLSYLYFHEERSFYHTATHEVGFALVVAVLIWMTFEVASKDEQEKAWNRRIDRIAQNVFFGVLGKSLSPSFMNEARSVAFDHDFERSAFHITYNLSDASYVDAQNNTIDFVTLKATAIFKIKNVGTKSLNFPISIGLPNPLVDEMKEYSIIHGASIKQGGLERQLNVERANKKLKEHLKNDANYEINCLIEECEIQPLEQIEVTVESTMAKGSESTEIIQTRYPTDAIIITLIDSGNPKRMVRARAIHRLPIRSDESGRESGIHVYRMETPLLPFQGFVIWWQRVPIRS